MTMIRQAIGVPVIVALSLTAACTGAREEQGSGRASPYAGLQRRDIAALAPERVRDLLAGRGAGYALAAELNQFPGPTHVLDLADRLGLSPDQQDAIGRIKAAMSGKARRLGRRMVELERRLDRAFGSGKITSEHLATLTAEIAVVEGQLRNTHLDAHLKTRDILSRHQVAVYDQLRGYAGPSAHDHGDGESPT